ncbi:MAG: 4-hydroxy-tetrahydrodipicolinate synthase [Parachlamydiaceae bacterium]
MSKFKGALTALITPFDKIDHLDEEGLRLLISRQVESGIAGIVFLGTTGEDPTLSQQEKERVMQIGKEECLGRTVFIVGTGSYSTKTTIENTLRAERFGAEAALIVTPYYNKPTQEGLYRHFKTIAEATPLPLIIYNAPWRTGQNMHTDTLKRLMEIPSIVGVKETSGNISQINDVIAAVKNMRPDFCVLSGDDEITLPLMALGGDGIISVISNLVPQSVVDLVSLIQSGDYVAAQKLHHDLMPLMRAAFLETNPIPIKAALAMHGLPAGHCRLPLSPLSAENAATLEIVSQMEFYGSTL